MSHNGVMKELIKRYGKRCFIDVLHLRKDTNRKYTGKSNYYTYHHIKRRSEGGQTTLKMEPYYQERTTSGFINKVLKQ